MERQIDRIDRQTDIPIIFYCIIVIIFKMIRKNKTNWWQIVEWIVEYNLVLFTVFLQKKKESIIIAKLKIKLNRKMGKLD